MNSDFKDLLKIFDDKKVKYLVIGGYAVAKHAEPRYTKDIDLWISNNRENAEKVYAALEKFGAPLNNITVEDFTIPTVVFQIGIEPSRIDILMGLKDLDFDSCWARKATATIGETEIHFISLDDLIFNKKLAGRPQDLRDVENLELKKSEEFNIEKPLADTNT
jgi:predicted nucleotidyltransferase